ncbi:MAG TPA: hypothetical protein VNJ07_10690 [Chitinophagales bacterium]|nr:hypothetical protein [Chitinophagales bacterium]
MKKTLLPYLFTLLFYQGLSQQSEFMAQVGESIKKAAEVFSQEGTNINRSDIIMLLFLLEEHFAYPLKLPPIEKFIEKYPELKDSAYFRLYDSYFQGRSEPLFPDSIVWKFLKSNMYSINGLTAWSIFCRKFPPPDTIVNILDKNADLGEYEMTHAALQLANLMQQECLKPNEKTEKLKKKLVMLLEKQINSDAELEYSDDLKYESMAMLYYLGEGNKVTEKHIRYIIENQQNNGTWSGSSKLNSQPHIHTSAIALWILLEYYTRHK